jgi:hypothetical protein
MMVPPTIAHQRIADNLTRRPLNDALAKQIPGGSRSQLIIPTGGLQCLVSDLYLGTPLPRCWSRL